MGYNDKIVPCEEEKLKKTFFFHRVWSTIIEEKERW